MYFPQINEIKHEQTSQAETQLLVGGTLLDCLKPQPILSKATLQFWSKVILG